MVVGRSVVTSLPTTVVLEEKVRLSPRSVLPSIGRAIVLFTVDVHP